MPTSSSRRDRPEYPRAWRSPTGSIANTLQCRRSVYEIEPGCRALQLFSFAFDGFITGFFTPLAAGGTVVLAEEAERRDPERICRVLADHHIEHFICIPTFFQEIVEALSAAQAQSLKTVVLAGEAADLRVIRKLTELNPSVEVAVEYGVTEAAVMSTIFRHQEKDDVLKIGKPAWNTEVYVLDAHRRVVPDGVPGELHIGGAGVALGYLNRPELSEQRFVAHPLGREGRVYATGDVACWTGDGNLAFLGRKDDQVKIRGYRVETRESRARFGGASHGATGGGGRQDRRQREEDPLRVPRHRSRAADPRLAGTPSSQAPVLHGSPPFRRVFPVCP